MTRNLTEQLVHDLGQAIVRGEYADTNALPSEADICTQFDVSRSATREAIKILASKGLLSSRPRQGIRISPESRWNLFDSQVLDWLLNTRMTRELLLEFTQMREGIEPQAAALAAEHATDEEIETIEAAWKRMIAADSGLDDPLDADIQFHIAIVQASGNRFYAHLSKFTETALRISIRFTNAAKGVAAADAVAHGDVLKAIRNRNPKMAKRKVQALLDENRELIRSASDKLAS